MCPKSDAEQDSAAEVAPPIVPKAPWRVRFAGPAGSWRVHVVFNDDLRGEIDMRALIYPVHARTRKSFGLMTGKLSVIESHNSNQFCGTFSRKKVSTSAANSRDVA